MNSKQKSGTCESPRAKTVSPSLAQPEPPHCDMASWYNPLSLLRTGMDVAVSYLLGTRTDARVLESVSMGQTFVDYSECSGKNDDDFWFDYMADTGDGWDSTFAMARILTNPSVEVEYDGRQHHLPRGAFLILGGDEVYPSASKEEYKRRLVAPFEWAKVCCGLADATTLAHMYAIPGNHDWYDGLVSFMRRFQQQRNIGIWKTMQERSYFALPLPHRWWLWGVDTQLESDIDWPQVKFFKEIAGRMQNGDSLIVCTAEPYWVYAAMRKEEDLDNNLNFLLSQKILGDKKIKLCLSLAGDLHIYRRHVDVDDENRQKIISGGGGAFVHPTHNGRVEEIELVELDPSLWEAGGEASATTGSPGEPGSEETRSPEPSCEGQKKASNGPKIKRTYCQASQYPKTDESVRLSRAILAFPIHNPTFGLGTAVVYLILGWMLVPFSIWSVITLFVAWAVGFRLCDDLNGPWFRSAWGGLAHGTCHVLAAAALTLWARSVTGHQVTFSSQLGFAVLVITGGYLLGSLIVGLYLYGSLNWFKIHHNEAFSALRNPSYKNFLRIRIDKSGNLHIYPIGLDTPVSPPKLIEDCPIRIEGRHDFHSE